MPQWQPEQRTVVVSALARLEKLARDLDGYVSQQQLRTEYKSEWRMVSTYKDWVYEAPMPADWGPIGAARHFWQTQTPAGLRLVSTLAEDELANHRLHTWSEFQALAEIDLADPRLPVGWWYLNGEREGLPVVHPDNPDAKWFKKSAGASPPGS